MRPNSQNVGILNFGIGNIASLRNAIAFLGHRITLCEKAEHLSCIDHLVLPGVGAFGKGMDLLRTAQLIDPIVDYTERGGHLLGICLGMQLLCDESEEFGQHRGLGLIPGRVRKLGKQSGHSSAIRLPHVDWAPLIPTTGFCSSNYASIRHQFSSSDRFYFIHSYAVETTTDHVLATARHDDAEFAAIIARGNIVGVQFHPEKSNKQGLAFLDKILQKEFTS